MGSLPYKQWYTPTATHLTRYFHPLHQPKTPVLPKIVPQSHTVQVSRILEIFHSMTPIRLEFEKKVPKCRLFCYGFCHWKTPYFLPCIHMFVWGECCLKHGQKLENFVFSKQNWAIWGILLGANFNKGDENKISFLQAQPTQLCIIWMNFIGGQGWYRLLST